MLQKFLITFLGLGTLISTSLLPQTNKTLQPAPAKTKVKNTVITVPTASTTTPRMATKKNLPKTTIIKNPILANIPTEKPDNTTSPKISFDKINTSARSSLVNIICTSKSAGTFSPISGSGVIIGQNGVILTNAHVAEYYLLKDFNGQKDFMQCTIRTGSPAYPKYIAKLIYISPQWVTDNANKIKQNDPTGTGEHDYAFLQIISNIDGTPVNTSFSYLPLNSTENENTGDSVLLASYPAEFLGGITIEKSLYPVTTISQISKLFTFSSSSIDILSVPGTAVSQKGSSGGAVVNDSGSLDAIMSTSSTGNTTGSRDLQAITIHYIDQDLKKENTISMQDIIDDSLVISYNFEKHYLSDLTKTLTDAINGTH